MEGEHPEAVICVDPIQSFRIHRRCSASDVAASAPSANWDRSAIFFKRGEQGSVFAEMPWLVSSLSDGFSSLELDWYTLFLS
jgi:hypothetical protein